MEKTTELWSVDELNRRFTEINFPEFQREPNIWGLSAKQKLIDSMLRRFDIGSLYFYRDSDGSLDCIDGRQRINAIASFLANNPKDDDNRFPLRLTNEIYEEDHPLASLEGHTWDSVVDLAQEAASPTANLAEALVAQFTAYRVTCVLLSDADRPEEFNLQFTRLNLGMTINAGERLHAMVGDMRDLCFDDPRLGQHPFLASLDIPTRRYAREQVAAQIVAQVFSLEDSGGFTPARHYDLQGFLKRYAELPAEKEESVERIARTLDALNTVLGQAEGLLRNRAISVSTVLIAWQLALYESPERLERFAAFITKFIQRLRWQVGKGLDADAEYRYLIDFQRDVTQASVEKRAVERRHSALSEGFEFWMANEELIGDSDFRTRTGMDPDEAAATE